MGIIELRDLHKTFHGKGGGKRDDKRRPRQARRQASAAAAVTALRGVSLCVEKGDIFGVVGFSGAGKSTLIRCINMLEKPESGEVVVDGETLSGLPEKELVRHRQKMGMIFQHFNLLRSKTVAENVALPLRYLKKPRGEVEARVAELLKLVDLEDKAAVHPAELSGGQKQRVAIARALACNPRILLSDEATSALDPQMTDSILDLLRELNRKLGLTIVIITHEMVVVREICNKVAVMEDGLIVEQGTLYDVFTKPQTEITRRFTAGLLKLDGFAKLNRQLNFSALFGDSNKLFHFVFIGKSADEPWLSRVISEFGIEVNIIYGGTEVIQGKAIGSLFTAIKGEEAAVAGALGRLKENGVQIRRFHYGPAGNVAEEILQ
jgi:D-methionine transport system ATP-binding protein